MTEVATGAVDGLPGEERAAILRKLFDLMLANTDDLAVIMTASNPSEAYGKEVVGRVSQAFWSFESSRNNK